MAGFGAAGKQASVKKNHLTVGRIANGAIVEREEVSSLFEVVAGQRYVSLNLRNVDFSTVENICKVESRLIVYFLIASRDKRRGDPGAFKVWIYPFRA